MTKARIDWMASGRTRIGTPSCQFISRTESVVISANASYDGDLRPGSLSGQHVVEYQILIPGTTFTISYWDPSSTTIYAFAWYDANHNFIGGRKGQGRGARTANFYFVDAAVYLRIYGIYREGHSSYTVNASMTPRDGDNYLYDVAEIRVKAEGDTVSQIVWPLVDTYVVTNYSVNFYDGVTVDGQRVLRANGESYAYVTGTVQRKRGITVLETLSGSFLPTRIVDQGRDKIDGEWLDRFHITSVGGLPVVKGNDLKTTRVDGGWGTNVECSFRGLVSITVFIGQQGNTPSPAGQIDQQVLGYSITLTPDSLGSSGGNTTIAGALRQSYVQRYQWTSGDYSYDAPLVYNTAALDSIVVSPNTSVTINGSTITFPRNYDSGEKVYSVTGSYQNGTYTDTKHMTVYGTDSGYSYSNLTVSASYPVINAGGGGAYPVVDISIKRSDNVTLHGQISNGETVCTVANGTITTTVTISYTGDANGYFSAPSRGTTTGNARTVGSVNITVTKTWKNASISNSANNVTCTQAANNVTEVLGTMTITAMRVLLYADGSELPIDNNVYQLNTAKETDVAIEVRATGSGTTTQYTYSSGVVVGGNPVDLDDDIVTPSNLSVTVVGGSSVTVDEGVFKANNQYVEDADKNYSISAVYERTTRQASLKQVRDEKIDSDTPVYTVTLEEVSGSNTLSAAGGEVRLKAEAYHQTGKIWKSDRSIAEGGGTKVYDINILTLVANSGNSYVRTTYQTTGTYIIYKYQHRDMEKDVTTDYLEVYAKVGEYADTSDNPLSYSVSNSLITSQTYEEPGEISWGENYTENGNYDVQLYVDNYTSEASPAPFVGASTTYRVTASHEIWTFHDGVQIVYQYQRYASWTSAHDDMNHKELVGTYPVYYNHILVSQEYTSLDNYSVASSYSWLTVNQNNQTIAIAAQQDSEYGTPQRTGSVIATNTDDTSSPQDTSTKWLVQQAYQIITRTPTQHTFEWDDTQSAIFTLVSKYTQFRISIVNAICSMQISSNGPEGDYSTVDPTTNYGSTTQVRTFYLKVGKLQNNYDNYPKITDINITPVNAPNVSQQIISITIKKYDGGVPTT